MRSVSISLYFCLLPQNFDWVNLFWWFFIWKLVFSVWSHFNLVHFLQWYPWENHIILKFRMCAINRWITHYYTNWFWWFCFIRKIHFKGCLMKVWLGSVQNWRNSSFFYIENILITLKFTSIYSIKSSFHFRAKWLQVKGGREAMVHRATFRPEILQNYITRRAQSS